MITVEKFDNRLHNIIIVRSIVSIIVAVLIFGFALLFRFGSIQSKSMIPALQVEDCVLYTKLVPFSKVNIGDIVIYETSPNKLIIHRVIAAELHTTTDGRSYIRYVVKGDNNNVPDDTRVTVDNYRGKVLKNISNSWFSRFIYKLLSNDKITKFKVLAIALGILTAILAIFIGINKIIIQLLDNRRKKLVNYWKAQEKKTEIEKEDIVNDTTEVETTEIKTIEPVPVKKVTVYKEDIAQDKVIRTVICAGVFTIMGLAVLGSIISDKDE